MTNRVTYTEVKTIITTSVADADITVAINTAHSLITQYLEDQELSEDILTTIELWLSAHFVAVRDPRSKSEALGDASNTYRGETKMGLQFTEYGQQAMLLDPTGILGQLGKQKAFLKVV